MKLLRSEIAEETVQNPIDLHSIFRDIAWTMIQHVKCQRMPTSDDRMSAYNTPTDLISVMRLIYDSPIDALTGGKWIDVAGLRKHPLVVNLESSVRPFEILIDTFGQFISVKENDVGAFREFTENLVRGIPEKRLRDMVRIEFYKMFFGSAVGQTLARKGMKLTNSVISPSDFQAVRDLEKERIEITEMVLGKMRKVLQ